ncbi:MAG: hypothetical protein WBP45_12435 [Daejeonella sp.]
MQKKHFYGFNLLLFAMLAATSCKKDKLPEQQPLKNTVSVHETAKVDGFGQNATGVVVVNPQLKPDPQPQPWKFMDPQPQPWTSMDPPPQPYKTNYANFTLFTFIK